MGNVRLVVGAAFNDSSHINIDGFTVARLKVHDRFGDYGIIHRWQLNFDCS